MVSSHAALYDFLRETFGIGSYDEMFGQPWHEVRIREIGKLKTQMRRRRVDLGDAYAAAVHARDNRLAITDIWQILDLVDQVRLERAKALRAARFTNTRLDREQAIDAALAAGQQEWAERLINADPREVADVIKEWQCSTQQ